MKKARFLAWVGAALVAGAAWAQTPQPKKNPASQTQTAQLNGIAGAAAKSGVSRCLARINQVTNFVTANSQQSGAYLFVSPAQPDKSLVSANLEVQGGNALAFASVSFAPVGSDGCAGMYEAAVYWGENCDNVAASRFPQLRKMGVIQRHVQVLQGDGTMRVFLMPAGQGCLSVKKEIIF